MEEKYRKLAIELKKKKKNNNNLDETMTTPCEEVKNANDYYEYENAKLKLKIKLLTDVIAEQREYTNLLEETDGFEEILYFKDYKKNLGFK